MESLQLNSSSPQCIWRCW